MSKVNCIEQAYTFIQRGNQALEACKDATLIDKHLANVTLAKCLGFSILPNQHYDMERAISLLKEADKFFTAAKQEHYLVEVKDFLANFNMEAFHHSGNHINLEMAIQYFKELTTVIDPNDPKVPSLMSRMGNAMLQRKQTFKKEDLEAAYEILNMALGNVNKDENFELWCQTATDLIDATILQRTYYPEIVKVESVKAALLSTIREVGVDFKKIDSPTLKYRHIKQLEKLGGWYQEEILPDKTKFLQGLADELRGNDSFVDLYIELTILLANEMEQSEAIEFLEGAKSNVDKINAAQAYLDICMALSNHHINQGSYSDALLHILESLDLIRDKKRQIDRKNTSRARSTVFLNDRETLKIPFALVNSGYTCQALQAAEALRFHPLVPRLEELLVISKQVDRNYWFLQQKSTQQFELFIQIVPKQENIDVHSLSKFKQQLADKSLKIKKAEHYYNEVQQLIIKNKKYSEFAFIDDLEKRIRQTSSWILLPLFSEHEMCVVLIPPQELKLNIFVSKAVNAGYIEALKVFSGDEHHGWAGSVMNHSAEAAVIDNNPNIPDFKKKALLNNLLDTRDSSFSQMESFLYVTVWEEVLPVIIGNSPEEKRSIAVIAQGPYASLPFGLARSAPMGKYALDELDISYVPSLYSLYALTERLKEMPYKDTIAFLRQEYDAQDEKRLKSVPIEKELIEKVFGVENTYAGVIEPMSMAESCTSASYWHFSTHGNFSWHDYAQSKIEWTNSSRDAKIDLTPELLAALDSKANLRLVTLSACQTGVPEFLDKELAPESFLTELLKSGAIGAIGTLWEVPDLATALILSKLYYFHIQLKQTPAKALKSAQQWLRDIPLVDLLASLESELSNIPERRAAIDALKRRCSEAEGPFEHPWYWAGFVLVGV